MPKVREIEIARYELHSFSFTVEEIDGKNYLKIYRKIKKEKPLETDSACLTAPAPSRV